MKTRRVAILIGGRPQIIKALPLISKIRKTNWIDYFIIDSGQHYSKELSSNLYRELIKEKPKYKINTKHTIGLRQISKMVEGIDRILKIETPDCLVVFGDMNSSLSGAIAASKRDIKIIHVEAGIRSGDKSMPEEQNRIMVDHVSTVLIAPNNGAYSNLRKEGIPRNQSIYSPSISNPLVINGGDIMLESLHQILKQIKIDNKLNNHAILTVHRAANTNVKKLKELLDFTLKVCENVEKIIFPVHPRTKKILKQLTVDPKFQIIKPVSYLEMISLCQNSKLILTDSGGLQKEACWLGKPCIILRDESEWPELISQKRAVLYKKYTGVDILKPKKEKKGICTSCAIIKAIAKI